MMKRNTLRLLALALVLVFCMSTMLACLGETDPFEGMTESERAFELYRLYKEKAESVSSATVTVSVTGSFSVAIGSQTATATIFSSGTIKEAGVGGASYALLSSMSQNTTVTQPDGSSVTTVLTQKEGFQDGKMFEEGSTNGVSTGKMYSVITAADYKAYYEKYGGVDVSVTSADCTTATSVLQEDGNWLITFTGFTADAVAQIKKEALAGVESLLSDGQTLSDVRLTCTLGADYLPKQMAMEFVFTNTDPASTLALPVLTQTQLYSDLGSTIIEPVDLTGYTNVGDLRQVTIYKKEVSNRIAADTGSFEASQSTSTVVPGLLNTTQSLSMSGTYTNIGGFAYTISGTLVNNGTSTPITISYSDGVVTTNNQTSTSTDATEKAGVLGTFDPAGITQGQAMVVSVVAGTTPNTYIFTLTGLSETIVGELDGATLQTKSEILTVTYDATGALLSSEVVVNLTLTYMGTNMTLTTSISCTHK